MADGRREFDDLVDDAVQQSVRPLYPYLDIAILGPYEGDCFAFLTELKLRLHKVGFNGAMMSTDQGNQPPEDATEPEIRAFNRQEANNLMDHTDVGLFLFLDHDFDRDYLSDEALEAAHEPGEDPREVNISVGNEIEYWIARYPADQAMVMVEDSIYPDLSSRVGGLELLENVHWEKFPDHALDRVETEAQNRCRNWVLDKFRDKLRQRYIADSSSP